METPLVISIVGPPASGKTTLCEMLEKSNGQFELFEAPAISDAKAEPGAFRDFMRHQTERALTFSQAILRAKARSDRTLMLCDRGIEDIICFTEYMTKHVFDRESEVTFLAEIDFRSDCCVFLDVDEARLSRREQMRRKPSYGRGLTNSSEYWKFYREWFLQRERVLQISIEDDAPEDTASRILARCCSLIGCVAVRSKLDGGIQTWTSVRSKLDRRIPPPAGA
jgi:dephospho-CoA kinase